MTLLHDAGAGAPGTNAVFALLGGTRTLKHRVADGMDAHDMLQQGMPSQALLHLIDSLSILRDPVLLEKVLGMSMRTIQRRKEAPAKALSPEQGGRVWKFAEIFTKATQVIGSQELAERWLERPALALNGRRPVDLLTTPAGVEMVEQLLGRIEYGVYT